MDHEAYLRTEENRLAINALVRALMKVPELKEIFVKDGLVDEPETKTKKK